MTSDTTAKATAATILRAVADLIETSAEIPVPRADISFYVSGETASAVLTAIASGLPCKWHGDISSSGAYEWLNLRSAPRSADDRGAIVRVAVPAADVCVEAGAKTVTVWQPGDALRGVLGASPLGDDR